jgi:hypothetical protein
MEVSFMRRLHIALLVPLVFLVATTKGNAELIFTATINGAQEVPPKATTATGFATFVLNDAMTALTYNATVFGLDFTGSQTPGTADNLIAAHIHASATSVPGVNAGVVFGFFGAPFNDNNPNDVVVTPFTSGVGGTVVGKWDAPEGNGTTLTAQLPNILAGRAYINFHTVQFPGGEIRGQILQQTVPEPATITLFLIGGAGLAARRLLKRRPA